MHGGLHSDSTLHAPLIKSIDYLLKCVDEDGLIAGSPDGNANTYQHSYALVVLSKARGKLDADRNAQIEHVLPRAAGVLIAAQKIKKIPAAQGGFRYIGNSMDSDLSCTAAAIAGLLAAREANVDIPDEVFAAAAEYASTLQNQDGGFGYTKKGQSAFPRGGMGLFVLQAAGRGQEKAATSAFDFIIDQIGDFKPGGHEFYGLYWATAAASGYQNKDRNTFAFWMYPYVLDRQSKDGGFGEEKNRLVQTVGALLAISPEF